MACLMDLPSEQLLLIFTISTVIQDAVQLSGVNRRLRHVWLENSGIIIPAVFDAAEYEDAKEFAIVEARLRRETSADPSVHLWLPCLVRNAKVAIYPCVSYGVWLDSLSKDNWRHELRPTSLPSAYYIICQVVLSYHHPALQPALRSRLETASTDTLWTLDNLCQYMCEWMDEGEQQRQGILKDRKDWTPEDELDMTVLNDDWDFAGDEIRNALEKRLDGNK